MQNLHNAVLTQTYAVDPVSVITQAPKQAVEEGYHLTPITDRISIQNFLMLLQDGSAVLTITKLDHMCSISGVALQWSALDRCFHSCLWLHALATLHADNTVAHTQERLPKLPSIHSTERNSSEGECSGLQTSISRCKSGNNKAILLDTNKLKCWRYVFRRLQAAGMTLIFTDYITTSLVLKV